MSKKENNKIIPFDQVIAALLDNNKSFSPTYLHRFSDLSPADVKELKKVWLNVDTDRRASLLSDLEDLNNNDTLVFFDEVSRIA
ncbi:MAG: hypothetical protein LWX83_18895, partial [Anaerolineae bacterium]|nr:hypothetical protein [Anaerolineae bacterium]